MQSILIFSKTIILVLYGRAYLSLFLGKSSVFLMFLSLGFSQFFNFSTLSLNYYCHQEEFIALKCPKKSESQQKYLY